MRLICWPRKASCTEATDRVVEAETLIMNWCRTHIEGDDSPQTRLDTPTALQVDVCPSQTFSGVSLLTVGDLPLRLLSFDDWWLPHLLFL